MVAFFLPFLLTRLTEPSTYVGLGMIANAIVHVPQSGFLPTLLNVGQGLAGLLGVVMPEKGKTY